MKILSMTATFGQLEHATLTLEPGLNVIEAPNEWGKSTWCAFLCAMLYGIDSRAHSATKAGLADKTRYEPWSGQLMSGRMELLWNSRKITIERSSTKRAAFRQFQAFETDTGLPIPELTAENCGQMLLGVEKEVFIRSAFIRFSDLPVTQNEALRRRLNALVTTGDESCAGDLLSDRLNKLKNEIRANRTHGLLPQAETQRQILAEKLLQAETLRAEADSLKAQCAQVEALLQAQTASDTARTRSVERLQQLRQTHADKAAQLEAMTPPSLPEAFAGLSPEAGAQMAAHDQSRYAQACKKSRGRLGVLLSFLPLSGLLGLAIPHWSRWLLAAAAVVLTALLLLGQYRSCKNATRDARALEEKYGFVPAPHWQLHISQLLHAQAQYRQRQRETTAALAQLEETITLLERSMDAPSQNTADLQEQLQQLHRKQGHCQGRMDSLGSIADLQAQLDRTEQRIRELTDKLSAIDLALSTLQEAKAQLQRRFAPRITAKANTLFSQITGGRYDRLMLSEDLSLQAAAAEETVLRSSLWRSEGTADQLYLALRLAVSGELMPDAPLVLDDALVRFDDKRLKLAMDVLSREAENRQVILFSCQSREKKCI